jgi:hypothetical protein
VAKKLRFRLNQMGIDPYIAGTVIKNIDPEDFSFGINKFKCLEKFQTLSKIYAILMIINPIFIVFKDSTNYA